MIGIVLAEWLSEWSWPDVAALLELVPVACKAVLLPPSLKPICTEAAQEVVTEASIKNMLLEFAAVIWTLKLLSSNSQVEPAPVELESPASTLTDEITCKTLPPEAAAHETAEPEPFDVNTWPADQ